MKDKVDEQAQEQTARIFLILGIMVLIVSAFIGIILLPLLALFGLIWATGALIVRFIQ
jgi:hypothetical protein